MSDLADQKMYDQMLEKFRPDGREKPEQDNQVLMLDI